MYRVPHRSVRRLGRSAAGVWPAAFAMTLLATVRPAPGPRRSGREAESELLVHVGGPGSRAACVRRACCLRSTPRPRRLPPAPCPAREPAAADPVAPRSARSRRRPTSGTSADPAVRDLRALSGKGMWIWQWSATEGGDAAAVVNRARADGLRQLWVRVGDSFDGFYGARELDALVPAAHRAGIAVLGWGFPYLYDPGADAARTRAALTWHAADGQSIDGFAADIEGPTEGVDLSGPRAAVYLALARPAAAGRPLVGTVYAPLDSVWSTYPYAAMAPYVDAFTPMVYWECAQPSEAVAEALARLSPLAPVAPIGQAFSMAGTPGARVDAPDAAEITRFLSTAWSSGAVGASFWSWQAADAAEWGALRVVPLVPDPRSPRAAVNGLAFPACDHAQSLQWPRCASRGGIGGPAADAALALCWVPFAVGGHLVESDPAALRTLVAAVLFLSFAHQPLTLPLVYASPWRLATHRRLFLWTPAVALVAVAVLTHVSLLLVAVVGALWNAEHTMMQRYGIARMYGRRAGDDQGPIEKWMFLGWLAVPLLAAAARGSLPGVVHRFGSGTVDATAIGLLGRMTVEVRAVLPLVAAGTAYLTWRWLRRRAAGGAAGQRGQAALRRLDRCLARRGTG